VLLRVGAGFAIFLAIVAVQRCSARDLRDSASRTSECASNAEETPIPLCTIEEWRELNAEIEAELANARSLYADMPFVQRALDETHEQFLRGVLYRPSMHAGADEIEGPPGFSIGGFLDIMSEVDLPEHRMRRYLRFLRSLDRPRRGLGGRWVSPYAELRVGPRGARIRIEETGAENVTCTMHARVVSYRNALVIDDPPVPAWRALFASIGPQLGPAYPMSGWTLRAQRRGAMLHVDERDPQRRSAGEDVLRPYCGGAGALNGAYFPAR
jgi:hypothetical protein